MFGQWSPFIWLIITLVPLLWMKNWISRHVQGLGLLLSGDNEVAMIVYFLSFLPGIVVHELSHWLAAKLLGVRTGRISIWPAKKSRGKIRLGYVKVARTDPLRSSLIGLAPLLGGSLIVFLIGQLIFGFGELEDILTSGDWSLSWRYLWDCTRVPDFWLWLYLIFTVSNSMLPSQTDRQPWRPILIFLALVAILFYLSGWVPQVPEEWTDAFLAFTGYLAYAFGLTVAVNLIFMIIIALLEGLVTILSGMRVEY
ncbi:MAG: hypothetical protein ACETWB_09730 [Anaerolineae bacterium]